MCSRIPHSPETLAAAIRESKATMRWKFYWRDIIQKYLVIIEGWPANIPMGNLSDVATSLPILERLEKLWADGTIHFRQLTEEEFLKLNEERSRRIENGELDAPTPRKIRSDKGAKRKAGKRGGYKSKEQVDSSEDDSDSDEENGERRKRKRQNSPDSRSNANSDSEMN
jgi:hypothetical protein